MNPHRETHPCEDCERVARLEVELANMSGERDALREMLIRRAERGISARLVAAKLAFAALVTVVVGCVSYWLMR